MLDITTELPRARGRDGDWTDVRIGRLRILWIKGLSCRQIAGDLGGVSRSAVIGKAYRLGLSDSNPRPKPPSTPRRPRAQLPLQERIASQQASRTKYAERKRLANGSLPPLVIEDNMEEINNTIPLGQRCSLLELNDEKCHWPIGDPRTPDFFFCGGKTAASTPYCGYHCRAAYQPPEARKDRRPSRA